MKSKTFSFEYYHSCHEKRSNQRETGTNCRGLDLKAQEAALRSGPDVVVATPGRLIDHLHNSPNFNLGSIEVLVLDEADRMLEEAFRDQMNELIRLCAENRQTLLFSATMTEEIDELASMSLQRPVKIFINENTDTALKLRQEFIRIRAGRETDRESMVAALVTRTFQTNTIVFVRTKKDCQRMQILLGLLGIKVGQMQSSLTQGQRIESLSKFKKGEIDVLVSTDLASRGLDIEGVQTVINMNMPKSIKQYIHRVGRTARAGKAGRSISLVGEEERKLLKEIVNSNADRTLKQRLVAPEVVEAYRRRIDDLEETIQQIDEEDRAEKELRIAESSMAKTQHALETGEAGNERRVWLMKESQVEKQRKREEKRQMKIDARKKANASKSSEEIAIEHEAAFHVRAAKRARHTKNRKIRAVVESTGKSGAGRQQNQKKANAKSSLRDIPLVNAGARGVQKPQQKNGSGLKKKIGGGGKGKGFTSALASVSRKSVKAARHGPEDPKFQKARVAHRMKTKKH
ncbi:hypothetical protein GCK72_001197 [Caenorhabditis remanei]|uniref:RNA helicase n=1 Tax=Caenorhabditis remanei TaxID=31234 RepID=A0A6A5HMC7_CAERE|nr:hypothetical protein GCK72_001197 [Caenorhabditis remanei]KAF1769380.1 hypothetical protein GCK72_001197 [Caenorhabditis remanei]